MEAIEIFNKMYKNDEFSKWLGIELVDISVGKCSLKMTVRKEMLNGFGMAHGGITYAFADSAFAFASNSLNKVSVSLNATMNYPASVLENDIIYADANEVSSTNKTGLYDVIVKKEDGTVVGVFRGTVYRTSKKHFE